MLKNKDILKVIAFDADDTLWVSETHFHNMEKNFIKLMSPYMKPEDVHDKLFKIEMQNIDIFGYGAKGFTLSMIEAAVKISNGKIQNSEILDIINMCKSLLTFPIEILPGVKKVLEALKTDYKLIVTTKGDLLDQEKKLERSKLASYFHHIEIVSEKHEENYIKLIKHLNIDPNEFLMIGNSLKSDILPVLNVGGNAVHVPFHITWEHEKVNDYQFKNKNYIKLDNIEDIIPIL